VRFVVEGFFQIGLIWDMAQQGVKDISYQNLWPSMVSGHFVELQRPDLER